LKLFNIFEIDKQIVVYINLEKGGNVEIITMIFLLIGLLVFLNIIYSINIEISDILHNIII